MTSTNDTKQHPDQVAWDVLTTALEGEAAAWVVILAYETTDEDRARYGRPTAFACYGVPVEGEPSCWAS